ncbi:hypothetical protein AK812_SmicGene12171 [Symbiodinium microadriaticum]|uniref:Uncharacterized protein n=1 Tax=Symbiodinium microadriaticum TaxID=2951 RepID=A0A1Q9EBB0_SYMMI|nr:hypothetical protein AK812_SmicGene12171 [Symbiodinium microadriaticum]
MRGEAARKELTYPGVIARFLLIRGLILTFNLFSCGWNKHIEFCNDNSTELTLDMQTTFDLFKQIITPTNISGALFLFFMRSLNAYKSKHASAGDMLPTAQTVAASGIFGLKYVRSDSNEKAVHKIVTFLFYNSVHAVDPATYITLASILFVDNPNPEDGEPLTRIRRHNSKLNVMKALISHPRELIPPFTHQMMKEAQERMEATWKEMQRAEEVFELDVQAESPRKL